MAFWKNNGVDPVRKFRFKVLINEFWWWAQTVDKPSFEVNSNEYLLTNHKFKVPGVLTWNDIKISMVDPGKQADRVLKYINASGYNSPTAITVRDGIEKRGIIGDNSTKLQIIQYSSEGTPIETWTLYGAFFSNVTFGDLDYSSDDLVSIQLTVTYDYAELGSDASPF